MILTLLALLTVLGYIAFWRKVRRERKKFEALEGKSPTGPEPIFPFGNIHLILFNGLEATLDQLSSYGDVSLLWLGPFLFIVPTTEKSFKTVAKKIDVYTREDFFGKLQRLSIPRALFSVDGNEWRHQRKLLIPSFESSFLKITMDSLSERCERVLLESLPQNQPVNIRMFFSRITVSTVMEFLFGKILDKYDSNVNQISERILANINTTILCAPLIISPLPLATRTSLARISRKEIGKIIAFAKENNLVDMNSVYGSMSKMEGATEEDIDDAAIGLIVAAVETTSSTMSLTVNHIFQNKECMAKLVEEIDTQLKGKTMEMSDMNNLPYLKATINEVLRFDCPVTVLSRRSAASTTLEGYSIPQGFDVLLPIAHRAKKGVEDCEKFNPDRWFGEKRVSQFFFNTGPHECVGRHFAMIQMMVVLANLFQKFTLVDAKANVKHLIPLKVVKIMTTWKARN